MKEYYDRRAPEYDDWYLGHRRFAERDRPGWDDEVAALCAAVAGLPPLRTLDVACGTGFLTQHLRGEIVGLDQSSRMLAEAALKVPAAEFVEGDALELPFPDGSFDRVFTGHFYGHLDTADRAQFLAEAGRVAHELVVVDSSRGGSDVDEAQSQRVLEDGSEWEVYKRWFEGPALADELGGGDVLFDGRWFVMARVAF